MSLGGVNPEVASASINVYSKNITKEKTTETNEKLELSAQKAVLQEQIGIMDQIQTLVKASASSVQGSMSLEIDDKNEKINGDFTKSFIEAPSEKKLEIMSTLSPQEKKLLFENLKEHYKSAGNGDTKSVVSNALVYVSISLIKDMPVSDTNIVKNAVINTLKFMNQNISHVKDAESFQIRDAAQWSGEQVLAEGNFNGCVEATKAFMTLAKNVSQDINVKYVSSFSKVGAEQIKEELKKTIETRNEKIIKNPPGHAVAEVEDKNNNKSYLVDASMFAAKTLGDKLKENELENISKVGDKEIRGIIKQYENKNDVLIQKTNNGIEVKLFKYGQLNNGESESKTFKNISEVNNFLKENFESQTVNFSDLENEKIIKEEKNGSFHLDADKFTGEYIIFDKANEAPFNSQYGENGSSTKTLEAIKKFFGIE